MSILGSSRIDLNVKMQCRKGVRKNFLLHCVFAFLCFATPEVYCGEDFVTFEMLSNLPDLEGKEISIKGFYYETKRGESYLASQPNLKSCCLGSIDKLDRQILLEKKIIVPKSKVVSLRGVLKTSPIYNEQGQIASIYFLKNPVIIQEAHYYIFYLTIICFILIVVFVLKKICF